ncbi:MAG: hypothetical protein M3R12_12540 [Actinomycetota bacterium]|nr:hypothetical protein [Actinomycetota bacterium]
MAGREWIERKWGRRLVLLPGGIGFLIWGLWLLIGAASAALAGVQLAQASDCLSRVQPDCIAERSAVVASGRVDFNGRGPDDLYVTLAFADGVSREVRIAYESEWRQLTDGEDVRLRMLAGRALEVVDSGGVVAQAVDHPTYRGINAGLEAPFIVLMGLMAPFVFLDLERRGRGGAPMTPLADRLGRAAPWVTVVFLGLAVLCIASLLFNLRPRNMAFVALATVLGCIATAVWQDQRSRMKP